MKSGLYIPLGIIMRDKKDFFEIRTGIRKWYYCTGQKCGREG